MTNDRFETGRRIRDFRSQNHLTQAQLAESLDVSTNFISEIETGKKRNLTGYLISIMSTVQSVSRLSPFRKTGSFPI